MKWARHPRPRQIWLDFRKSDDDEKPPLSSERPKPQVSFLFESKVTEADNCRGRTRSSREEGEGIR